jgi:hypothetical protein
MNKQEEFLLLASNCARAFMTDSEKEHTEAFEKFKKDYYANQRFEWNDKETYRMDEEIVVYGNVPKVWVMKCTTSNKKLLCMGIGGHTAYVTEVNDKQILEYKNRPWCELTIEDVKKNGWIVTVGNDNLITTRIRVRIK